MGLAWLFVVAALPALIILPIRFLVRESPEWERGQKSERPPRVPFAELIRMPGWASMVAWSTVIMACGFGVYYGWQRSIRPCSRRSWAPAIESRR